MKVLITGHQGYIGAVMTPMLLADGHQVTGLDTDLYAGCDFSDDLADVPSIRKDLRDLTIKDLAGFDAVIHLGGLSNDPVGDLDPNCTYDINYHASVRMAELAREAGVKRFLFSSSCSIYGAASPSDILTEEATMNPVTAYGISKMKVEEDLVKLATPDFSPVYLRNATAYGVSPRLRMDLVVNNLVGHAFATGRILLKSDGTPWRPLVHIEDISRAFLAVLRASRDVIHNQAFNVGRDEDNLQIRDIAELVKRTVPRSEVSYAAQAGPDTRCYRVNFAKIHKALPDFKPQWTVARGIEQHYAAYKAAGLQAEDLEGARYVRIKRIRQLLAEGSLDTTLRWKAERKVAAVTN
jgi:nucleoside-diphosphate-sugar epimerase